MGRIDVKTVFEQAVANHQAGLLQEAAVAYRKVLQVQPDNADALHFLGIIENSNGNHDLSVRLISRSVALMDGAGRSNPNHANAIKNLGNALRDQGDATGALAACQRALKLEPHNHEARNNMGNALRDLGRQDDAFVCYEQALAIKPAYADAYVNMGNTRREQGRLKEAIQCYHRALAINPRHAGAHSNLAIVLLARGEFAPGWQEYEWRWEGNKYPLRPFPYPVWNGAAEGKTILVYAEQGIGDEIMFASCLPDLVEQGNRVVLECEPRLVSLFSRSFPDVTIYGDRCHSPDLSRLSDARAIDFKIAAGSLPLHFRPTLESFPDHAGYLVADTRQVEHWQQRYAGLGDGMKVGLSWRGGRVIADRKRRSIGLDQWESILRCCGIHFINLQYGDCRDEIAAVQNQFKVPVHDWDDVDSLKDLDTFAAQIAALDLVISVDNSTVHMAGSLGIPVWTLQPFSGDWRWLAGCEDSYWYPEMRQFWQPEPGAWKPVMESVADQLYAFAE